MFTPSQLLDGVQWVWLVWLVGLVVLLRLSGQALRRWRRPSWKELAGGEEGVSYSLSYVLTAPIYLMFVCLVFEASWLLVAKVGTLYAAHAGARSAIVWSTAKVQPTNLRQTRIEQAVWTAMTPFVTGHVDRTHLPQEAPGQAVEYAQTYQQYAGNIETFQTMRDRYLTAASRTTISPSVDQMPLSGDLTVVVTYRAPLHIPGVSRFLDPDGHVPYEYPITSSATLPAEAPASENHTLGIDYHSR